MAVNSIREEKKVLRKQIKHLLSQIGEESIKKQSASVMEVVVQLPEYKSARSISIFLSMPGREISTMDIARHAIRQEKRVFIPYIHSAPGNVKDKAMDMLRIEDERDLEGLLPDSWGIPSLSPSGVEDRENALGGKGILDMNTPSDATPELDLIFMPGMAFDSVGSRLGHGKGFYDRYLSLTEAKLAGTKKEFPKLIGLALGEQLLSGDEVVPVDANDWKVDQVIAAEK